MRIAFSALTRRVLPLQFRLRGMFLTITICGVWLGLYLHAVRRQEAAVRALRAQGVEVQYGFQYDDGFDPHAYLPDWLVDRLGEDFFVGVAHVTHLGIPDDSFLAQVAELKGLRHVSVLYDASRVTDAGVARLANLADLSSVCLPDSQISEESFRVLGRRGRLIQLDLRGNRVSDTGLAYLEGNAEMQVLILGGNAENVTDAGMSPIGGMLKLENLDLADASITSKGMKQLRRLSQLSHLRLPNNTRIGDEGLRQLAHLNSLDTLELCHTGVTSKGLQHLKNLTNLRVLDLSDNRGITDEGIAHLSELVNLEVLKLNNTAITSAGVRHLKRLTKLWDLDLSENAAIKEDVLPRLAPLTALKCLDLHYTEATGRGKLTAEHLRHFSRLGRLQRLDLSGTGADTASLQSVLPRNCRVFGSRPTSIDRLGLERRRYPIIALAAKAIARRRVEEEFAYNGNEPLPLLPDEEMLEILAARKLARPDALFGREWPAAAAPMSGRAEDEVVYNDIDLLPLLPNEEMLKPTLHRMLAVCQLAEVDAAFEHERPLVEAFLRRVTGLGHRDDAGRNQAIMDLFAAARSNARLRRLYLTAMDFELADALAARVRYLEEVKEKWALSDVESDEYSEAPRYLRVCLRDAASRLGLLVDRSSNTPPDEIIAMWEQTARR